MDWVKVEYERYGRKEYVTLIRCMNREDVESFYDRYECTEDKDTAINYMISLHGFPLYLKPANSFWLRSRLSATEYTIDENVHTIVREVPMNEVCRELV